MEEFIKKSAKDFGKRIRIERIKKEISQEQLAEKAEIHRTTLGAIEGGKNHPNFETIVRIAKGLEVSPNMLFNLDF